MQIQHIILNEQTGNITAKNATDKAVLVGIHPASDSGYAEDLKLILYPSTGKQNVLLPIPDSGYYLQLFLGDFTGDGRSEIMIRGDFGGTGDYQIARIYTYEEDTLKEIFNQDQWSQQNTCTATYLDDYKLEVKCSNTGSIFLLDFSSYSSEYLSTIYTSDQKVRPQQSASVSYLTEALPIKSIYQSHDDLLVSQRIIGTSNADTLGYVQTRLNYSNNTFTPIEKGVITLGQTPTLNDTTTRIENNSFYTFVKSLLCTSLFPEHIISSLNIHLSTLHLQESLTPHPISAPSYSFRKEMVERLYKSPKALHKLLFTAHSKEHTLYEHYRSSASPELAYLQLKKCSVLICLDAHLKSLNHTFRQQIYYGNAFNIESNNLDLIINALNEDRSTLYLDGYIVNLKMNPISQITDFQLTLYDANGKVFAKKTFSPLEINGSLRPYEGKRIFLSFFSNEYSLFDADTSTISWNYTYNTR